MKKKDFVWVEKKFEKKLGDFEKVIKEMWDVYDDFIKQANDLPYWSIEMTNVGHLAVAAGRLGFPVMLEYNTRVRGKNAKSRKFKGKKIKRVDMWLQLPNQDDILIEAKQNYLSLLRGDDLKENIKCYIQEAFKQMKGISPQSSKSLALFFVPVFMHPDYNKIYDQQVKTYVSTCEEISHEIKNEVSFFSYYFLEKNKVGKSLFKSDGYYYPGIVIFGKFISN